MWNSATEIFVGAFKISLQIVAAFLGVAAVFAIIAGIIYVGWVILYEAPSWIYNIRVKFQEWIKFLYLTKEEKSQYMHKKYQQEMTAMELQIAKNIDETEKRNLWRTPYR